MLVFWVPPGGRLALAEAVQRPTMNFVAIKTPEQSDLLSLAGPLALDPPGFQALGASQSARHRPRQQARTHRLGGARPWPPLRAKDHPQCHIRNARSGSPREWTPSLSATLARQSSWIGQASDGGLRGNGFT